MEVKTNPSVIERVDLSSALKLWKTIDKKKTSRAWLMKTFKRWMINKEYSTHTVRSYIHKIELLVPKKYDNPKLNLKQLNDFLSGIGKTRLAHSAVKTFFKFVYLEFGRRFAHVEYQKPKIKIPRPVIVLRRDEVDRVIEFMPEKHKFFTRFIYMCALRISEPYRIKVGDIDWSDWKRDKTKHGHLYIKYAKRGKERSVPINPYFMWEIAKFLKDRDGTIVPKNQLFKFKRYRKFFRKKLKSLEERRVGSSLDLSTEKLSGYREKVVWNKFITAKSNSFQRLFKKICKDILMKSFTPHKLRASKLTHLLEDGATLLEVSKFAGHSSITTTQRYLQITDDDLTKSFEKKKL